MMPTASLPPSLIQENDEIRCASIYLMGNLSKFGSGEQVFKDQIHNVLVSLLLHLVDPNPHVVKVAFAVYPRSRAHACVIMAEKDAVFVFKCDAYAGVQVCNAGVCSCGGIGTDHSHVPEPPP